MPKKILFVCTGNTCRSSMAEYLFRHLVEERGKGQEILIKSAGVAALENDPPPDQAVQVMGNRGIISIKGHQATLVNEELIKDADLILTMTCSHKERLLSIHPEAKDKIFTLKEYTALPEEKEDITFSYDIEDPFGKSVEVYQRCADEIEIYLIRLLEKI